MAIDLNELATALGQIILRFRVRRRLAAEWTTINEVLLSAELGLESDTDKMKIGDGVTPWNGLNYFGGEDLDSRNAGVGIDIEQFQPTTGGTGGDFASDAQFSQRAAVIHFDALNTDGTAIDSGPLGVVVTAIGTGTTLSAVQSKYGGMSTHGDAGGTIDRTGWAITDTGQFDFGAGDFTFEGWFYASGNRGGASVLTMFQKKNGSPSNSDIGGPGIRVSDDGSGSIAVYLSFSDGTTVTGVFTGDFRTSHSPGSGSWVHFAVVRATTKVKVYLNGVGAAQTGTDGDATSLTVGVKALKYAQDSFYIGANGFIDAAVGPGPVNLSTSWRGYIDDVRISKVAQYTANFTPPAAQFPGYASPVVNDGAPYPKISNIGVLTVVAGSNVSVDNSDPLNPVVSSGGGSGINLDGAVATYGALPSSGLTAGDAYLVYADNLVYVWSGSAWPANGHGLSVTGNRISSVNSSAGVLTLDCGSANYFTLPLTENITSWVLNNVPTAFEMKLEVTQNASAAKSVAWPASFLFSTPSKIAVTTALSGLSYLDAVTFDGGTKWFVDMQNDPVSHGGSVTDPYFSSVSLLLHFDGANAAVVTTDSSSLVNTITAISSVSLSNVQAKFGATSSLHASGTGWRVADRAELRMGSSDFTIEGWFYPVVGTQIVLFEKWGGTGTEFVLLATGGTAFLLGINGSAFPTFSQATWGVNQWNHVVLSRVGTSLHLFINGNEASSSPYNIGATAFSGTAQAFEVGYNANTPTQSFVGYIDEFRVTKGVGRYTIPFSVPTTPYPNS